MANVFDIGQFFTELIPNVDKMKLHKLCYFAQGWHLAWTGRPLFGEELQAWRYGPVSKGLHDRIRPVEEAAYPWGVPYVPGGNSEALTGYEKRVITSMAEFYGVLDSRDLSNRSHGTAWEEARQGLPADQRSQTPLNLTTVRHEFTRKLRSGESTPQAPEQPCDVVLPRAFTASGTDAAHINDVERQIEHDWWGTFRLLSTS